MNERLYRLGAAALRRLCAVEFIAGPLDLFAKVWLRHRKLRVLLKTLQFDSVIDGGANVGEFAHLVRAALPQAHLICVEPHRECAIALRGDGFEVVEAALWDQPGRLRLIQPTPASTSSVVTASNSSSGNGYEVDAVRLDSLPISGSRLLVKLDLQGAEFAALEGMGTLWERCEGLLVEVSIGTEGTADGMRELLVSRGYHEYSTTNELVIDGQVIEADKLWLKKTW